MKSDLGTKDQSYIHTYTYMYIYVCIKSVEGIYVCTDTYNDELLIISEKLDTWKRNLVFYRNTC